MLAFIRPQTREGFAVVEPVFDGSAAGGVEPMRTIGAVDELHSLHRDQTALLPIGEFTS